MSLTAATAHAFAGRLSAAERALERTDRPVDRDATRWLRAYLAAARGRFANAERGCRRLIDRSVDEIVRARASVTLGSVLRQTGRHAEARRIEIAALATAPTAELRRHLTIGLAADAVGLGELDAVDRALAGVGSSRAGGWRTSVRERWVRCERALLAGEPSDAVRHARIAVDRSRRAGARRHEAKSLLFLGASLQEAARHGLDPMRSERAARRALKRSVVIAHGIGARPVDDVARRLLGRAGKRD